MLPPGSEGFGRQVQDLDLDRWLRRRRSGHGGVGVTADGAGIYVIYESIILSTPSSKRCEQFEAMQQPHQEHGCARDGRRGPGGRQAWGRTPDADGSSSTRRTDDEQTK